MLRAVANVLLKQRIIKYEEVEKSKGFIPRQLMLFCGCASMQKIVGNLRTVNVLFFHFQAFSLSFSLSTRNFFVLRINLDISIRCEKNEKKAQKRVHWNVECASHVRMKKGRVVWREGGNLSFLLSIYCLHVVAFTVVAAGKYFISRLLLRSLSSPLSPLFSDILLSHEEKLYLLLRRWTQKSIPQLFMTRSFLSQWFYASFEWVLGTVTDSHDWIIYFLWTFQIIFLFASPHIWWAKRSIEKKNTSINSLKSNQCRCRSWHGAIEDFFFEWRSEDNGFTEEMIRASHGIDVLIY